MTRQWWQRASGALAAAVLLGGALPIGVSSPAAGMQPAEDRVDAECAEITPDITDAAVTRLASRPLAAMGVDRAHDFFERHDVTPGSGVVVAVIDSGVTDTPGIRVVEHVAVAGVPAEHYQGTAVAGVIAGQPRPEGPVGIAPGASILDVQVYDEPGADEDSDGTPVEVNHVLAGLDEVYRRLDDHNIKVVNVSLMLPESPGIQKRINRLWRAGVIVVAPTGDRNDEAAAAMDPAFITEFGTHDPGEDAARSVFPAGYDKVVAVNASMTGADDEDQPATGLVLASSRTMVAAPTAGAVSYTVRGGTCLMRTPSSAIAAAEVSGVLALLQSAYDERPAQAIQRLLQAANGRPDIPDTLLGAGEVEVYAALTRPLTMDANGDFDTAAALDEPQQVEAPPSEPDLLATTRRNAVWWGLVGVGALLLALVLRPVLARRQLGGGR